MDPDIQRRIEKDFADGWPVVLREIQTWQAETQGLLDERLLRAVIYLARGDFAEFMRLKKAACTDFRDVLWQAEYECGEIRIRDFNRSFGHESERPVEQ